MTINEDVNNQNCHEQFFNVEEEHNKTTNFVWPNLYYEKYSCDQTYTPYDFDWVFIAYKEECADQNFVLLKKQIPFAKQVRGVKGFHTAHQKAAELAETEWFFTVDGDARVFDSWLQSAQIVLLKNPGAICWKAINPITDTAYGNGGVKLWHKTFLEQLKSHEEATSESKLKIDFCYDENYKHVGEIAGTTDPLHSSKSSFCAGFREGVKLLIENTQPLNFDQSKTEWPRENRINWTIWCNLTLSEKNPFQSWGSFGARFSSLKMLLHENWKKEEINDLDDLYSIHKRMEQKYGEPLSKKWLKQFESMGLMLEKITGIAMPTVIDEKQKKLFKSFCQDIFNSRRRRG